VKWGPNELLSQVVDGSHGTEPKNRHVQMVGGMVACGDGGQNINIHA